MDDVHQFIRKQPCYEQHIIEIKKIYEAKLFSILVPHIYEGFRSLYNIAEVYERKFTEAMKSNPNVEKMSVLVIFQKLLSEIPNLSGEKIKRETDRIKTASRSADIFSDLIKAVIKANIVLLTYNTDHLRKEYLETRYHESVKTDDFIHSCYVEAARSYYSRPEIFWTQYDNIVINQNKRLCHDIIQNAINETINKTLPMREILSEYIGSPYRHKDDIRIYVLNKVPDTVEKNKGIVIDPDINPDNGELIGRGIKLNKTDEEYMLAAELINRDLGVHNNGGSLLEDDNDNDNNENFDENENHNDNNDNNGNNMEGGDKINSDHNLSLLLTSGTDLVDADHSNLSNRSNHSNNSNVSNNSSTSSESDSTKTYSSNSSSNSNSASSDSKSNNSNLSNAPVVDGIKMINLKTSITGRGQARSFFEDAIPDANKKAKEYRRKIREINQKQLETKSETKPDNKTKSETKLESKLETKIETKSETKSKTQDPVSDKSGIKIIRTDRNNMKNISNNVQDNEKSEDVEELLAKIMKK